MSITVSISVSVISGLLMAKIERTKQAIKIYTFIKFAHIEHHADTDLNYKNYVI